MAHSASSMYLRYTGAVMRKSVIYGILVLLVLMVRSWIGATGTVVILLVILAWNLWDTWRELHR